MLRTSDILHSVRQDDWFTTVDLKHAYFHIPIAPHHWHFAFEGKAYQLRVLSFSISLASKVFTRLVAAVLSPLQSRGMRILPRGSRVDARKNVALLLAHTNKLCLRVNHGKSSLRPCQRTVFIGIQLDSQLMRATLSQRHVDSIVQLLHCFRRGRSMSFRSFQSLLGMLTAASSVVPLGLLKLRPLQIWLNSLGLHPQHY